MTTLYLLLAQEEDLLLAQEEDLLLVHEEDLLAQDKVASILFVLENPSLCLPSKHFGILKCLYFISRKKFRR